MRSSLRSKRSSTKRKKFGLRKGVFRILGRAQNGARAKRWKEGGGEGEGRERLPANPTILKPRSPTNGAPDWRGPYPWSGRGNPRSGNIHWNCNVRTSAVYFDRNKS